MTELSENAYEIAKARYLWENENTWQDLVKRICKENVKNEVKDQEKWYEEFYNVIEPMLFIPAGRILRNLGKLKPSTSNCNFLSVEDNIESIGQTLANYMTISSYGGGTGLNFSTLRPKNADLVTKGGQSSGPNSFLEIFNTAGSIIETGGNRRSAGICIMDVRHPDVIEFINAKIKHDKLDQFNISVSINSEFLNAVENNDEWEFRFGGKVYGSMKAREIWDLILNNMLDHAEPGLVNWDNLRKNNTYFFSQVDGLNPCITGDTLVAVADGRDNITIKQLADEGKDVPVFCLNNKKNITIKMMRNPRITGYKKKILKITMDNGNIVRCTKNHKIMMKNGEYREAYKLKIGDRLNHVTKYIASLEEIFSGSNSRSSNYKWWNSGQCNSKSEHRMIASFYNNIVLKTGNIVHHKDFNSLNNSPDNIEIMSRKKHTALHGDHMRGKNNPANRFPERNWLISKNADWKGDKNGRYKGISPDAVFKEGIKFSKILNRRPTRSEWIKYCSENKLPYSNYSFGKYKTSNEFLNAIANEANVINISSFDLREYKKYNKLILESDLDMEYDYNTNSIYVNKECEYCGREFKVPYGKREQSFCSQKCVNPGRETNDYSDLSRKYFVDRQRLVRDEQIEIFLSLKEKLNRNPFKKEWEDNCRDNNIPFRLRGRNHDTSKNPYIIRTFSELIDLASSYNFKIINIEEDGYEDVYNGTVDEFHNFCVLVSTTSTKSNKKKYNYINNLQCGELPLENLGVCNLGSLILPNFIINKNTNWQLLSKTIRLAVRFLDNVIDLAFYPIQGQETVVKNARRQGLGTTGLSDYFFMKEIRYGDDKSLNEIEKLYRFIRDEAYKASVELAIEKGPFPKFERIAFGNASFVRKLPAKIRMMIKDNGIRNAVLLTCPPVGSTSLLANVTSGIDPLPFKGYKRVDGVGERIYVHPLCKNHFNEDWFVDSYDLKPEDHLNVQTYIQKYIDSGVSKTIILPSNATTKALSKLLLEYLRDLKGVTVFRDESREKQVYYRLSKKEIKEYIKNSDTFKEMDMDDVSCRSGMCEL